MISLNVTKKKGQLDNLFNSRLKCLSKPVLQRESNHDIRTCSKMLGKNGHKVSRPNSVTYLNGTPIFEWWVVRCRSKNKYQKDMCLKEARLCAQILLAILGSIVNIIGGTYWPSYDSLPKHLENS
jgi:hypothetical protein